MTERDRIEIEVQCSCCGESWTPLHIDYVRGTWRRCPRCRGHPTMNDTKAPTERATEAHSNAQPYVSELDEKVAP